MMRPAALLREVGLNYMVKEQVRMCHAVCGLHTAINDYSSACTSSQAWFCRGWRLRPGLTGLIRPMRLIGLGQMRSSTL